ncbi:MAG: class I SAM-dependent methyltransferase [Veillonellaceae bacterium]|nr:class I SAM-dependent methyltransferase [Veillonellaceae bacterium]
MPFHNVLALNRLLLREVLTGAKVAVDATCGNGHDAAYLLTHGKQLEELWCCDLQETAVAATRVRLATLPGNEKVHYHAGDHAAFLANFSGRPDVCIYNLGYLPGGDHALHTRAETTLAALKTSLAILAPQGVVSVTAYPGTPAGEEEYLAVRDFVRQLPQREFEVLESQFVNQVNRPPRLIYIEKRSL